VAIEAGSPLGWRQYVGEKGIVIGLDHFGASAPDKVLYEKFGLTADQIVEKALELLKDLNNKDGEG
jgi:transketolase